MGLLQQLFRKKHKQYTLSKSFESVPEVATHAERESHFGGELATAARKRPQEGDESVDYTADDDHLQSAGTSQTAQEVVQKGCVENTSNACQEDQHQKSLVCDDHPTFPKPSVEVPGDDSLASKAENSEPLEVPGLVYLTEDHEHGEDTISVVSDVRTAEELAEELTELSKAIQALEVGFEEVDNSLNFENALDEATDGTKQERDHRDHRDHLDKGQQQQLERDSIIVHSDAQGTVLGSSPARSSSTMGEAYSRNMTKLYNDLALRLMDVREYDQALAMLQKAEMLLDTDASWKSVQTPSDAGGDPSASQRDRLRSITYNNIGCLYKRRAMPQEALNYLHKALTLESAAGDVHNSASTHLNLSAAYSALSRFGDALWHAERAIIILQRQLWGANCSFQDGVIHASRLFASIEAKISVSKEEKSDTTIVELKRTQRQFLANANILAMAYYNAAVENERLGKLREAQVSYHRATTVGHRFLPQKSATMLAITKAQKAFLSRQQQRSAVSNTGGNSTGGVHALTHSARSKSSVVNTGPGKAGASKTKFLSGGTVMSTATWTSRNSSLTEKKNTKNRRG